jgi:protein-glutamine gamma-glutamyltransferase
LHDFDGHAWRRTDARPGVAPPLDVKEPAYRYVVSLEPNHHDWIFVLDWPASWDRGGAFLTSDYMLVQPGAVSQPLDVTATSFTHVAAAEPLGTEMRLRDTRLPPGRNPRTQALAARLRAAHPDDLDYVHAVLDLFRREAFYYTLTPPRLAGDSVDGFLFDSRRGFCGHYASAFATLLRAANIPARVVTGYQGGTYNRFANYWILRQSDAHAWNEVWIANHGWLRIDPTSMVAPERVERGLNDLVSAGQSVTSRWQQHTPWLTDTRLRLDALRLLWRERILRFDEGSQTRLLAWMHVPEPDGRKLVLVLAACLTAGMGWLTWQVRRDLIPQPRDRVERAYATLCRRLAAVDLGRAPAEGAEAFAVRVAARRPDLAATVVDLCRRYSELRYGRTAAGGAAAAFIAGVRAFRPRGSRGSS